MFVIGATSRLESIDPALRTGRRLGREIAMGIPDEKARRKILEVRRNDEGCVNLIQRFHATYVVLPMCGIILIILQNLGRVQFKCLFPR